jgi:alpha-tubulin suppressor-like RCC1 family protein
VKLMAVACGAAHAAAVTEDGGLWAWGAGDHAQLGLTSLEHRQEPTFVGGLKKFATSFVMLAACWNHSAALAADGAVWTWGNGRYGALGLGDEQATSTPTRLGKEAFGGSAAVMVACGRFHTMVATVDGRLWTFGRGGEGRLGHCHDTLDKLIPTLVLALRDGGAKIVMVAAGAAHSIGLTADGDVYTWGHGRYTD